MGNFFIKTPRKKEPLPFQRLKYNFEPILTKQIPICWFIGPNVAGKTTQATLVANNILNCGVIALKKLINSEGKLTSERGLLIRELLQDEDKVPKELLIDMIKEQMLSISKSDKNIKLFIVTGFPNSVIECNIFLKEIYRPELIILFEIQFPALFERINANNRNNIYYCLDQKKSFVRFQHEKRDIESKFSRIIETIEADNETTRITANILEIFHKRLNIFPQSKTSNKK